MSYYSTQTIGSHNRGWGTEDEKEKGQNMVYGNPKTEMKKSEDTELEMESKVLPKLLHFKMFALLRYFLGGFFGCTG